MAVVKRLYGEYTLILLVLVLGVCASGWFAWQYQRDQQERTLEAFRAAAQDRIELIRDKIDHNDVVLRSVVAFFRSSEQVSREEFATFTGQLLIDYPYIRALAWVPHVSQAEREAMESNAGYPGYRFRERNGKGAMVVAQQRDEYFPIYYVEPLTNGNENAIGFDVGSDPERFSALNRARQTRQVAATARVGLLQSGEADFPGIVFYAPVFLQASMDAGDGVPKTYETLAGFVASVVPLADMLDAAIKPLTYSGVNIVMHDLSAAESANRLLYVRSTRLRHMADEDILRDFQGQSGFTEKAVVEAGGRKWEIAVVPAPGFFSLEIHPETYLIFAGGLVVTVLLAVYMFSRVRENERINHEVAERTEELARAKREIEMILLSTHEGITGLDHGGRIRFCNSTAGRLLGYRRRELIGQDHHQLFHSKRGDGSGYRVEDCPIQRVLEYGEPCHVEDEVFWSKTGDPVEVEYVGSPILDGGEVTGAVLVFRNVAERRAMEKELERMARFDHLTGLANRTMFMEVLKDAISRAKTTGGKVGVVYLDLNGFKNVNDTLGHAAGDRLLKEFADRLKSVTREGHLPARMGGDEFTILVDNVSDADGCVAVIDRLKAVLNNPIELDGRRFEIGASIGIAFYPDHGTDNEGLVSRADAAMYQAKMNKTGSCAVFSKPKG